MVDIDPYRESFVRSLSLEICIVLKGIRGIFDLLLIRDYIKVTVQ